MREILLGLILAAVVAMPAPAQDYRKNFRECAKELGLNLDPSYTHRVQTETGSRVLRRWRAHGQAQQMAFYDCLSRKARLNEPSRVSR